MVSHKNIIEEIYLYNKRSTGKYTDITKWLYKNKPLFDKAELHEDGYWLILDRLGYTFRFNICDYTIKVETKTPHAQHVFRCLWENVDPF